MAFDSLYIGRFTRFFFTLVLIAGIAVAGLGGIAKAAVGDTLATLTPSPSGNGRAMAFDPLSGHLFYTNYGDDHIYVIDTNGSAIATISPSLPGGLLIQYGALAWQPTLTGGILWGGRYDGSGAVDTIDPATGAVTPVFRYPFPAGDSCYSQASGYIDGLALDPSDNSLWLGDDAGRSVFHVSTDGTPIATFQIPGGLCRSGLAVSGDYLWMGFQSGPDQPPYGLGLVQKSDPSALVQSVPVNSSEGPEGIALDQTTFPGKCVAWTNQFGGSTIITAREVGEGSCSPSPFLTRVVVMGDSYASGEGTYNNGNAGNPPAIDYYPATATVSERCHRSPGAYAPLLGVYTGQQDGTNDGRFVACSGSTTAQIISGAYNEPSQLSVFDQPLPRNGVVVISAGGDDANFSGVLTACTDVPFVHSNNPSDCAKAVVDAVRSFPAISKSLGSLYDSIESRSNGAHLVVVGYPKIFPNGGSDGCNWISADKQRFINQATDNMDGMIARTASMHNATFVDTRPLFAGHEVCGASTGVAYINDLQLDALAAHNCPDAYVVPNSSTCSQSYHPNSIAYAAEARLLEPIITKFLH